MSNTPRTDAAAMPIDRIDTIASRPCNVVHEDVCRQLERELAEVNEKLRQHASMLKSSDAHNNDMFCKLEKERELHSETKSELADMTKQRDALAEALPLAMARAFNRGYQFGHEDTVESTFVIVNAKEALDYFADDVRQMLLDGSQPEAQKALAAVKGGGDE
jgi:hypothetical protein